MSSMLYVISSVIFVCYVLLHLSWKLWKRKYSFLPSHSNIPWLGSLPYLTLDAAELYKERLDLSAKYNFLYVVWLGAKPNVRAGRVEYIEALLGSRENLTKGVNYKAVQDWLGTGLVTSTGNLWKQRRMQLTGAFHFTILHNFMEIYEQHARKLVEHLGQLIERGENILEVQALTGRAMLDVICETSMGVTVNALESTNSKYVEAIDRIKNLSMQRFIPSVWNHKFIYPFTDNGKERKKCLDIIHTFIRDVITQNMALRKVKRSDIARIDQVQEDRKNSYLRKKKKVFIDILLDLYEEGKIDTKGIEDEVNTFMVAGHDTTSSAISWILYEIGRHADIQSKLHQEVDELAAQDISLVDTIRSLKYMESVIKESLRIHPPVSAFARHLDEDIVVDGNMIPAGTHFLVDVLGVHLNPQYWPNPHIFDPQRFYSNESTKRNPYCFIPFSAGARNCIGQKFAMLDLKVFLFTLLSKFNVESIQDPKDIKPGIQIIISSMNGIHIKFDKRQ